MSTSSSSEVGPIQRATRIGSAAAITLVGGTIFVDGQPVSAATFNVSVNNAAGAGSLFQAVTDANAAPGADTITFSPGLVGPIDIGATTIKIKEDLTITGPGSALLEVTNQGAFDLLYLYNGASLTISGLTLNDAGEDGIAANTTGDLTLTDVVIDDATADGIDIAALDALSVSNSHVTRSGDSGVASFNVAGVGDVNITDSIFDSNVDYGVYLDEVAGNVVVSGSAFVNNGEDGLSIHDATGNVSVTNSNFDFNRIRGLYVGTTGGNVTLTDLSTEGNQEEEIQVDVVTGNVLVERVTGSNSREYGVHLDNVTGSVTVRDLTISNFYDGGLYIDNPTGAVLVERLTVSTTEDTALYIDDPKSTVTVRDVTINDTFDDDAIDIDGFAGGGAILLERISLDHVDDGIDIDGAPSTVTLNNVDVTNTITGDAVLINNAAGAVVLDAIAIVNADEGIDIGNPALTTTLTNIDVSGTSNGQAIYIDNPIGAVLIDGVTLTANYEGLYVDNAASTVTVRNATITDTSNGALEIDNSVGNLLVEDVVIDGSLDNAAITLGSSGSVTLRRASARLGDSDGVRINGAGGGLTIEDVTLEQFGSDGIELYSITGAVSVENVTIDQSDSDGVRLYQVSGVSDFDSVTITNSGSNGVDIAQQGAALTFTDLHVEQSEREGIEIYNAGTVVIDRSTISNADDSGVYAFQVTDLQILNSTISENRTDDNNSASGLELYNSTASVRHSTISDNGGPIADPPPQIEAVVRLEQNSTLTVDHSIVADNGGLLSFSDDATAVTLTVTDSIVDVGTGLGGSTIEDDPELDVLQDNGGTTPTMKPLPGSPAIDAGDPAIAGEPTTDQRGAPRKNGVIDIGAVEIDTGGTIAVGTTAVTVDEADGTADITLTRTGGQDFAATVDFATAAGTAAAGADFTAVSETVTFADNQLSATVSVPIIDDGDDEPDELFTGSISAATGATLGAPATATVTITDNDDPIVVPPPPPPPPPVDEVDAVSPIAPQRFADTRPNGETFDDLFEKTGKLDAGDEIKVKIAGRGGVPADAVGVVMNVTAVNAEGTGFVTAHACVSPRPLTSSLNYTAGVNLGNEVIAGLSSDGSVCLYSSAAANLTVDVVGYIMDGSPLANVTPARLLDTRTNGETVDNQAEGGGKTSPGDQITLKVAGRAGVPADAAAVVVNVTAIRPDGNGFVTVHPCVSPRPNASSLNHVGGVSRGNELIASLNADGELCLYTSQATDLAVDVVAYIPAGSSLSPVTPARLLDSRSGQATVDGVSNGVGKFDAGEQYTLQVTGRATVPAGATAAIVNVTAIAAEGNGFVTVHPCLTPRPLASSLNYIPGVNGGNEIVASLNSDGELCLYTSAKAHLTVDIVGYLE